MIAEQTNSVENAPVLSILVVDDDENVGKVFQRGFRQKGVEIVYFSSARQALEWTEATTPVLAIVDVVMPDMTGVELCLALRNRENTRELPIVLLSAVDEAELKKLALLVKAVTFVSKPFAPRQVFEIMRSHLAS